MPQVLPQQLIVSLQNITGFDENAFIKAHEKSERITSIRYNPAKLSTNNCQLPTEQVPWCPFGYYLNERPSFTFDPFFHAGLYYVQEASSMFLWQVLQQTIGNDITGKKVLDLCAAPGGKSTLLASYFADGLVVANEVIKKRANTLAENITKWGTPNIVVTNSDPQHFQRLQNYFDVLVIDAPCSGSGLFRKDAIAINEWSEENVTLCSLRQRRIIADAYPCLKQNGVLIYATCSYSREEDEDILDWMMDNFNLSAVTIRLSEDWHIVESQSLKHKAYGYRFYPDKTTGEGFYIAAFINKKGDDNTYLSARSSLTLLQKKEVAAWQQWIQHEQFFLFKQKETVIALPEYAASDVALLQQHLYIKQAGVALGTIKGNDIIPHHSLAVSTIASNDINRLSLTKEQAIQFLQKKEVNIDTTFLQKGWYVASYCGIGLGWLKVLPNRTNNYYPTEWRILKN